MSATPGTDLETYSVHEFSSVGFCQLVQNLPAWQEVGLPISGDKSAEFFAHRRIAHGSRPLPLRA